MAEIKKYPEESKQKLEALLEETKEARTELDKLDKLLRETDNPTTDMLKTWARQSVGWGNYLRKKFKKLEAACINEKDARYMEIKFECGQEKITFADGASKIEAEGYISPLRTVRNIFEAYVISAENNVSVCRMHFYGDKQEQITDKDI
jgi:predicted nuclease with TOPRIM domain